MTRLSLRGLAVATLARQWLLEPRRASAEEALHHLVALQSQVPGSPVLALRARVRDFSPAQLNALVESGAAVRLALFRSTVHLALKADAPGFRTLVAPVLERFKVPAGVALPKFLTAARRHLATHPTPAELGAALAQSFPAPPDTLANLARCRLPLVQLPPRGVWGPQLHSPPRLVELEGRANGDVTTLITRLLRAFGPMTVADLQKFTGLTKLAAVVKTLELDVVEHGAEKLFDLPDAPRPPDDTPTPPRLLGDFDSLLLAFRDLSRLMDLALKPRVMTSNGLVRPVVLINGRVAGTWAFSNDDVQVDWFVKPPRSAEWNDELSRTTDFLRRFPAHVS